MIPSSGILKYESLVKFFDSLIDGTADLGAANAAARSEQFEPSPEEQEIEKAQEAQKIALAHGGFSDIIDFEEAIKKHGTGFHDTHGFGGSLGDMRDMPMKKDKSEKDVDDLEKTATDEAVEEALKGGKGKEDDPILKVLKAQKEKDAKKREAMKETTPKTGDAGQIVSDAKTAYEEEVQPETATASGSAAIETETVESAEATTPADLEEEKEDAEISASPVAPPEPTAATEPQSKDEHTHVKGEL